MSERFDVIVLGAGMAGLTAAKELTARGLSVVVLEARDRIGGRLHTAQVDGTPVDLGGSWIHGLGSPSSLNAIYALTLLCGLKVRATDYEDAVFYDSCSRPMDPESVGRMNRAFEEFSAFVAGLVERDTSAKSRLSVDAAVEMFVSSIGGLPELQRLELLFQVHNHIESYWAGDSSSMAIGTMDEVRLPGADVVLCGGYGQLVASIASGLDVRTGHEVQAVRWRALPVGSGAAAVSCRTARHGTFLARRAVITLPLGVLKSEAVSFEPSLAMASPAKSLAICRLGTGIYNKVLLLFDEVFWDDRTMIHRIPPAAERGRWAWILNLERVLDAPALVGFMTGSFATEMEALSDEAVAEQLLLVLHGLYPGRVTTLRKVVCTRWGQDPHARMSFTYIPVGATTADCDALRKPLGNTLYFAGEATSRLFYGTVHGAHGTGLQAAEEVVSAVRKDWKASASAGSRMALQRPDALVAMLPVKTPRTLDPVQVGKLKLGMLRGGHEASLGISCAGVSLSPAFAGMQKGEATGRGPASPGRRALGIDGEHAAARAGPGRLPLNSSSASWSLPGPGLMNRDCRGSTAWGLPGLGGMQRGCGGSTEDTNGLMMRHPVVGTSETRAALSHL